MLVALLLSPAISFATSTGPYGDSGGGGSSGPTYYSFEDLRGYIRDNERFHFENASPPSNAYVDLPYLLDYSLCASKNNWISAQIKAHPSNFKIDSTHICYNWQSGQNNPFDWNRYRGDLSAGDLIFTRGDDKMNTFAQFFTSWTHVVIVTDPNQNQIFDSTLDNGVLEHKVPDQWSGFGYYTCKRINGLSSSQKYAAIQQGVAGYQNLPYLPKVQTGQTLVSFVIKWCDKNDLSSMYCSKLVWNTFRPYLDLNTRRTSVGSASKLRDTAPGNYLFSWIGVSPDNVYFSPALAYDFDWSSNL